MVREVASTAELNDPRNKAKVQQALSLIERGKAGIAGQDQALRPFVNALVLLGARDITKLKETIYTQETGATVYISNDKNLNQVKESPSTTQPDNRNIFLRKVQQTREANQNQPPPSKKNILLRTGDDDARVKIRDGNLTFSNNKKVLFTSPLVRTEPLTRSKNKESFPIINKILTENETTGNIFVDTTRAFAKGSSLVFEKAGITKSEIYQKVTQSNPVTKFLAEKRSDTVPEPLTYVYNKITTPKELTPNKNVLTRNRENNLRINIPFPKIDQKNVSLTVYAGQTAQAVFLLAPTSQTGAQQVLQSVPRTKIVDITKGVGKGGKYSDVVFTIKGAGVSKIGKVRLLTTSKNVNDEYILSQFAGRGVLGDKAFIGNKMITTGRREFLLNPSRQTFSLTQKFPANENLLLTITKRGELIIGGKTATVSSNVLTAVGKKGASYSIGGSASSTGGLASSSGYSFSFKEILKAPTTASFNPVSAFVNPFQKVIVPTTPVESALFTTSAQTVATSVSPIAVLTPVGAGVPLLNTNPSSTQQKTLTKELSSVSLPIPKPSEFDIPKTPTSTSTGSDIINRATGRTIIRTRTIQQPKIEEIPTIIPQERTQQKTTLRLKQAQTPIQQLKNPTPVIIAPPTTFNINTKIRKYPFPNLKTQSSSIFKKGGFTVFLKRFGVFNPIARVSNQKKAFSIGKTVTSNTLGATFKVEGRGVRLPTKIKGFKRKSNLFIELPKFRLNRPAEVKELNFFKAVKGGRKKKK